MNKVWQVAWREYLVNIKRIPFWLMTLGLPAFFALVGAVMAAVLVFSSGYLLNRGERESVPVLGIVDHAGVGDWAELTSASKKRPNQKEMDTFLDQVQIPETLKRRLLEVARDSSASVKLQYQVFSDESAGKKALQSGAISSLLTIPADFEQSLAVSLLAKSPNSETRLDARRVNLRLRNYLMERRFPHGKLDQIMDPLGNAEREYLEPERAARAPDDPVADGKDAEEEPEQSDLAKGIRMIIPFSFSMMLMFVILFSADRLLRGLVEEKSNRVMEFLLSSVTADQLMAGKVLGLGAVGLTQMTVWMTLMVLPFSFVFLLAPLNLLDFLLFTVLFVGGYFMLATPMLGFGSLGNNLQEANQWVVVFIMISILPVMFLPHFLNDPSGPVAQSLTYFPFTTALAIVARLALDAITGPEIALGLVCLALGNFLAVKFSAKIFRVGILMTGKPPNPLQLWRTLRQG